VFDAVFECFPFDVTMKVEIHQGDEEIDPMSTCHFGLTYVVKYLPIIVDVPPFGQMWVDPWTTVESLQDTLSQVHYGNRANVRMVCNGSLLDATTTIAFAAKVGPLRAKIYCLPGGANWTLTSILTELQSLLVEHGHPSKDVEKKAHEVYDALDILGVRAFLKPKTLGRCLKLRVPNTSLF